MAITEAQKKASYKWRSEKVHRVALDFTLADYDRVKAAADAAGLPVGTYCRRAIDQTIRGGLDPAQKK